MRDIIINRSRIPKAMFLVVLIFFGGLFVAWVWKLDFIGAGIAGVLMSLWYLSYRKQPKRKQALIKINEERLWTRHEGDKKWPSIICIKFRRDHNQLFMDLYISNNIVADEEVSLSQIDVPAWWLKRVLKKHVKVENH